MKDYSYFLKKETVRGIREVNLLTLPVGMLRRYSKRPLKLYILSQAYLGRFDLVSYDVYKTPYYWWVILAFNDIKDSWDASLVGSIIKCPNILDIHDFLHSRWG